MADAEDGRPDGVCVVRITIPGLPVPKARARVFMRDGKYFAATPERTKAAQEKIAVLVRSCLGRGFPDATGAFSVYARFYGPSPILEWPADVDNLKKLVLDSLSKVVWKDDRQVLHVDSRKCPARGELRTELAIFRSEAEDKNEHDTRRVNRSKPQASEPQVLAALLARRNKVSGMRRSTRGR